MHSHLQFHGGEPPIAAPSVAGVLVSSATIPGEPRSVQRNALVVSSRAKENDHSRLLPICVIRRSTAVMARNEAAAR